MARAKPQRVEEPASVIPKGDVANPNIEWEAKSRPKESAAEQKARIERERLDGSHKRWRESILFGVTILVVGSVFVICCWTFLGAGFSPEDKKWATGVIGFVAGGLIGRLTKVDK